MISLFGKQRQTGTRSLFPEISEKAFALAVLLAYAPIVFLTSLRHEMWRDEVQAWVEAYRTGSLSELLTVLRLDGHFLFWHLCLRALSVFGHAPEIMQVFNFILAIAFIFLLAWKAPFSRLTRALLCFNYYFLYEYAVKPRPYLLGVFFLMLACIFYKKRRTKPVRLALALVLAAFSTPLSLILAAGIAAAFFLGMLTDLRQKKILGALSLLTIGLLAVLYLGAPSHTSEWNRPWVLHLDLRLFARTLGLVQRSVSFSDLPAAAGCSISAVVLLVLLFFYRKFRPALTAFLISVPGLFFLMYAVYSADPVRHYGFFFLTFLFCAWIYAASEPQRFRLNSRFCAPLISLLLLFQAWKGLEAAGSDILYPFSCAKETALYLKAHKLDSSLIAVESDYYGGAAVAGYLQKEIYFPASGRFGYFVLSDGASHRLQNKDMLVKNVREKAASLKKEAVLLTDEPIDAQLQSRLGLEPLQNFTGALEKSEEFYIYRVLPRKN